MFGCFDLTLKLSELEISKLTEEAKSSAMQKKRQLQGSNLRGLPHGISSPTP